MVDVKDREIKQSLWLCLGRLPQEQTQFRLRLWRLPEADLVRHLMSARRGLPAL